MEHIVYFLGAGFSAPLGLPVVANFLVKSKDMYAANEVRYRHFAKVFELIRDMNVAKSYYSTDLFNIEEILSILEMRDQLRGTRAKRFIKYILEVVQHYTPDDPITDPSRYPANWHDRLLADAPPWGPYFYLLLSLFSLRVEDGRRTNNGVFQVTHLDAPARYSIITLNYDLVLEKLAQCLCNSFQGGAEFFFDINPSGVATDRRVPLAKLHGSADTQEIIPPTWNKGINRRMAEVWTGAHEILKRANQIRIIGYSLPLADAYIKYLLKSAAIETPHLKKIDILCRDGDGQTRRRYREFIKFDYARFAAADIFAYIDNIRATATAAVSITSRTLDCNKLEVAHEQFFSANGTALVTDDPR